MSQKNQLPKSSKFRGLYLAVFAIVIGTLGYVILSFSKAAPVPPTVYLNPSTQTVAPGATFTVAVRENSGTTAVNAVQANFSYPAALIDFVSMDTSVGAFKTQAQATGAAGQINIGVGKGAGTADLTGDQLIANVTFRAKTTGGSGNMAFTTDTALVNATTYQDILGSLSATGGSTVTVDTTAPATSITAPANNATINLGNTVSVTATATDASAVSKVEFYVDGALKSTSTASPYTYSWNTNGLTLGAHTLQAKATDPYGNVGSSTVVNVTLADQTAPTVSLTAPTAGSTVNGTITVSANAADNTSGTGVGKVEFYVDNVLKNSDTTPPYSFSLDTKTLSDGNHSFTAKAYDNATPANSATSSAVAVTVDNADHTAPTTPASFRVTGTTLTGVSLAWNASTDNVGVTGYRVSRNGTVIGTVTTLTYNDSNLSNGTAYTYTVVALDAANNASAAATVGATTLSPKQGDINNDNQVDINDLAILLSNWGTATAASDINKNGKVDIFDLSILLTNYGK